MEMTSEDRKGIRNIRNFIDRMEAFLLTHDDQHPVLAGSFGSRELGGCPVAQITGLYSVGMCASEFVDGEIPSILINAIAFFVNTYDEKIGAWQPGTDDNIIVCQLGKARPAIRTAIEAVKTRFDLDEAVPIEEPAVSEAQIPVAV